MAFRRHDLVKETSTTTGTGSLTLAGAVSGFKTFTSSFASGDTLTYVIAASNGEYEIGTGTFTAPSTLARTTLTASSTDSFLDLPTGTHSVFCTLSAKELTDRFELSGTASFYIGQHENVYDHDLLATVNGRIPVTQIGHGFTLIGTPVYTADGSTWAAAAANDADTIHTGVVASIDGDDLVVQQSGVLSGITFATLTPGEFYFLADDGSLSLTEGTISAPVLQALTSSSALVLPYRASGEAEIQSANITDATDTGLAVLTAATVAAAQQAIDLEPGVDIQAFMPDCTQLEMETGTEPALRAMSPLRIAQAFAASTDAYFSGTQFPASGLTSGRQFYRTDRKILYAYESSGWKPLFCFGELSLYVNQSGDGDAFKPISSGGGATTFSAAVAELPSVSTNSIIIYFSSGSHSNTGINIPFINFSPGAGLELVGAEPTVIATLTATGNYIRQDWSVPRPSTVAATVGGAALPASGYAGYWLRKQGGAAYWVIWDNSTTDVELVGDWVYGSIVAPYGTDNGLSSSSALWPVNGNTLEVVDLATTLVGVPKINSASNIRTKLLNATTSSSPFKAASQILLAACRVNVRLPVRDNSSVTMLSCSIGSVAGADSLRFLGAASGTLHGCHIYGAAKALSCEGNSSVEMLSCRVKTTAGTPVASLIVAGGAVAQGFGGAQNGNRIYDPYTSGFTAALVAEKGGVTAELNTALSLADSVYADSATYGVIG